MQKSGEDYLEAILLLSKDSITGAVRTTDIARKLNVSKPSVSRAMNLLREDGYIFQETYGDILLTKEGEKKAKNIYERHTLLTKFFTEVLGVDRVVAEHDACLIEHDISQQSIEKLSEFVKEYKK